MLFKYINYNDRMRGETENKTDSINIRGNG